jgi:hypothetical protein
MKESSCHNPKMDVYYQEVCKLEDKFDSLKLNHMPQRLNKAADKLAKTVSAQELVLVGVFARDQHKPLVCYEEPGQAGHKLPALGPGAG